MSKVVRAIGYVWLILAALVITVGSLSVLYFEGWWAFQDLMSPFNVANWLVVVITLAPGIGLLMLAEKLGKK